MSIFSTWSLSEETKAQSAVVPELILKFDNQRRLASSYKNTYTYFMLFLNGSAP